MAWKELRLHLLLWAFLLFVAATDWLFWLAARDITGSAFIAWVGVICWTYHCLATMFGPPGWVKHR